LWSIGWWDDVMARPVTGPFGGTWAIHDVRLSVRHDGDPVDVLVSGDRVLDVGPGLAADVADRVVGQGGLLLPAYVDTHIHLDKVLIRDQLAEHDGTLAGAIASIHAAKRAYDVEDVRHRARAVIESSVLTGTTRLRSHVDVDTIWGTRAAARCRRRRP
jgi:cytosine deaminase